jgi:GNAT superfamily N-acetyltransferase
VHPDEGAELRSVRLRALQDAPNAFASSLEVELAHPSDYWAELAHAGASSDQSAVFVAVEQSRWIGMAASRWFDQDAGIAQLWGLWVEPDSRGRRVGGALVDAIVRWASDRGAATLRLGVTDRAADTALFYARLGFSRTGETKPLPPDGAVTAFFLAKSLGSS